MPIRIMHVVDTLKTGGLESGVVRLIRSLDPERFEHRLCAMRSLGPLADQLPPDRVKVFCLDNDTPGFSIQAGALARHIRETKPHIVHSRNWGTIEAIPAGWYTRSCALVHSEHGLESVGPEPIRRRCFRRLAFHLADRVFSVSYQLRDWYARSIGFPANRIGVIHNGVDTQRFTPRPQERIHARARLGIEAGEFSIGAVGRLEPVKDLFTLLRALAACGRNLGQWRLLLAGKGREESSLRNFVNDHPEIRNRVVFLGEVGSQTVPDLLNALDLYVLPSITEGICNALLEAMATALPVIASATGGNPEVVVAGESGLLFPVGDPRALAERLELLCLHPELRTQTGQRARQRILEHFSLESMVRQYERLYTSLAPREAAALSESGAYTIQ